MNKFIYVFSSEHKDILLSKGYTLLKDDKEKNMYVFENKNELCFSDSDVVFVYSDTLTF